MKFIEYLWNRVPASWGERLEKLVGKIEPEMETKVVSLDVIRRNFAYDAGLNDPELALSLLGYIPSSEESGQLEERDSRLRVGRLLTVRPILTDQAQLNGLLFAGIQKGLQGLTDEEHDQLRDVYTMISLSAILASWATLLDAGLAHMGVAQMIQMPLE